MRKRRHVVLQMSQSAEIPIESGNDRRRARIDIQIKLLELAIGMIGGTHPPTEWLLPGIPHINSRQRVPLLVKTVVPVLAALEPLNVDKFGRLIPGSANEQHHTTGARHPTDSPLKRPGKRR